MQLVLHSSNTSVKIGFKKFGPCSSNVFGLKRRKKHKNPIVFSTTNSGMHL
jgi:hypothetical protein